MAVHVKAGHLNLPVLNWNSICKLTSYHLPVRFNLFAPLQNVPLWTVREEGWEWNIVRDLYNQRRNLTCFHVILCSFQEWIGSTSFVHAFLLSKKWSPFFVILFLWFSYFQQIAAFASFPYHCCVSVLLQNTFAQTWTIIFCHSSSYTSSTILVVWCCKDIISLSRVLFSWI